MIKKLKVGDKVRVKNDAGDFYQNCGNKDAAYLILTQIGTEINSFSWQGYNIDGTSHNGSCNGHGLSGKDFELINNNQNKVMSNLKEKFALVFKQEPQKSFIKAGITDGDDVLTEEGSVVFLSWLLKQNADAFKTAVVDPILADEKKCE